MTLVVVVEIQIILLTILWDNTTNHHFVAHILVVWVQTTMSPFHYSSDALLVRFYSLSIPDNILVSSDEQGHLT
jgi:hypothetical protein